MLILVVHSFEIALSKPFSAAVSCHVRSEREKKILKIFVFHLIYLRVCGVCVCVFGFLPLRCCNFLINWSGLEYVPIWTSANAWCVAGGELLIIIIVAQRKTENFEKFRSTCQLMVSTHKIRSSTHSFLAVLNTRTEILLLNGSCSFSGDNAPNTTRPTCMSAVNASQ